MLETCVLISHFFLSSHKTFTHTLTIIYLTGKYSHMPAAKLSLKMLQFNYHGICCHKSTCRWVYHDSALKRRTADWKGSTWGWINYSHIIKGCRSRKRRTRIRSVVDAAAKQHKDTTSGGARWCSRAYGNLNLGHSEDTWTGEQIKHSALTNDSPLLADNDGRDAHGYCWGEEFGWSGLCKPEWGETWCLLCTCTKC